MKQTVWITGGAKGIGKAVVKKFLSLGHAVGFIDWDEKAADELLKEEEGSPLLFTHGSVANATDLVTSFKQTTEAFGQVSSVIANAAIHKTGDLLEVTEEDWDLVFNVNVKGVVFALKTAIPHFIQHGGGSVVIVGSDQCLVGKPKAAAYGASKGALAQLTKSTAIDFAKNKIRVNAVCPGAIKTDLAEDALTGWAKAEFNGDTTRAWEEAAKQHPIGRCGTPEEVANLTYFLASNEASFMTGSLVSVDGGSTSW